MSKALTFLAERQQKKIFAGAICAFGNAQSVEFFPHGFCSFQNKTPIDSQVMFDIQSISKVLATVPVLLKLVERNQTSLDSPVAQWIPAFRDGQKQKITLRHLANYSSGLSDDDSTFALESVGIAWNQMFAQPLHFNPGENISYADVGYRVLGRALEIIGSAPLHSLARELIWQPCEMTDTCYKPEQRAKVAGPDRCLGRVEDIMDQFLGEIVGCDGVFSSAQDIARFCQMLLNGGVHKGKQILAPESLAAFFAQIPCKTAPNSWYESLGFGPKALGWEIGHGAFSYRGTLQPNQFEKAGGGGAFIWLDLANSKFFIYLTNHGRPEPFTEVAWNRLVDDLSPAALSQLIE